MSGQQHAPAVLYPRERPGTHYTGGWVGPRASVDQVGQYTKQASIQLTTKLAEGGEFCFALVDVDLVRLASLVYETHRWAVTGRT